jgi:outer membrane protein OmpA-like peptidoglycan-associated protein
MRYHWTMRHTEFNKAAAITSLVLMILITSSTAQTDTISVFFDHNEDVRFEAKPIDDRSADLIQMKGIMVIGHTDHLGSDAYNEALSFRRAESVARYLMSQGVSKRNLSVIRGDGELPSPSSNSTGYGMHRRVDVIIQPLMPSVKTPVPPRSLPVEPMPASTEDAFEIDTVSKANIVLDGLSFIGGRHFPTQESIPVLEKLLETMKKYPTLEIEIQGHICCEYEAIDGLDADAGTMNLSENRAKYVYKYLIQEGISEHRMTYIGKGSSDPKIFPERTELDRQANRRVELKITKF